VLAPLRALQSQWAGGWAAKLGKFPAPARLGVVQVGRFAPLQRNLGFWVDAWAGMVGKLPARAPRMFLREGRVLAAVLALYGGPPTSLP
jgi:hypothetical protein